jgi:hypothetical protein
MIEAEATWNDYSASHRRPAHFNEPAMYYPDLSTYEYPHGRRIPGVRNVGWLDTTHDFPRGQVSQEVLARLRWLSSERRVAQTRGYHYCPFCPSSPIDPEHGSAEIWVPDNRADGFFAAPELLVHYVAEHSYAPPGVFIEAVESLEVGECIPDLDRAALDFTDKHG